MTREEIAPTDSPGGMKTDATGLGTFAEDSNDMSQLYPDEQLQLHPLDGNWNEVTEEELTAAFNDFNKETSQDGLAYPEHGTMDKRNIPFNETLSSSLDSFSNEQPDAETLENGTKSHDNETESIDLASLFGENEDEVQDGQNGLNEKENSFTGPLLPSNESKLPQVLTRPPKCRLTLPRPSLLTLPQTPQEFLQQHAHPGTQQAKQQLQQRVGPRVSFGTLNLIHPTPTPKRSPKAANAKQVQAPRLRTSRQSQRAGTSSVPSMTSSSNTFGALNVASQYAPSEIPQPANRHQHFTTDSRQPMQSFASPKAQTTIFNGSFDNDGHEYLGNRSTPYYSQRKVSCARTSPIQDLEHGTMSRLRMQILLPTYLKLRITHPIHPLEPFFPSAFPSSLNPPQRPQQMEIPNTGSRIEHEDTLRYSSPPRLPQELKAG